MCTLIGARTATLSASARPPGNEALPSLGRAAARLEGTWVASRRAEAAATARPDAT